MSAPILARVRRLLLLVSSIIFVDTLLFTALTPLVPGYVDEFDLSKAGAGLLVGAYGAGALFGGIPGGLAAAKYGPKRAVVAGLLLLSLASFAFAAADAPPLRALGGIRIEVDGGIELLTEASIIVVPGWRDRFSTISYG